MIHNTIFELKNKFKKVVYNKQSRLKLNRVTMAALGNKIFLSKRLQNPLLSLMPLFLSCSNINSCQLFAKSLAELGSVTI